MPGPQTHRLLREVRCLVGDADRDGLSDGQLLDRFVRHRDEAAFDRLVRRYGRLVFGVCRKVLADPHAAEDAFQATFLVLVHKARSLDRTRPVADWLYTVAFRLACRSRANAARRRDRELVAARNRTAAVGPETPDDMLPLLHEELNRLPERHRSILVLSYLEGRTYAQVARAMGCPVGTVGFRLTRAREALRERLAHRGVAPAAGVVALLTAAAAGAAVPASLSEATVRAGLWFAGEPTAGAVASAQAVELARGVVKAMSAGKWAMAASVVVAVGLCGTTAWLARSAAMTDSPRPATARAAEETAVGKPLDLPPGATARLGSSQFRHGEAVFFIAYTADSQHLVTAGRDNAIRLWDRQTGRAVRSFERAGKTEDPKPVEAGMPGKMMVRGVRPDDFPVALSADGKRLAAGKGKTITVWDVATGKAVRELTAAVPVYELAFTPDGQSLVAVDTDQTVALWDPAAGKVRKTLPVKAADDGGTTLKTGGAVSPAGTHFVQQFIEPGTGNGSLRVIDLATGETKPEIKLAVGGAQSFAFSADGKSLAWTSLTDGITVWDLAGHKEAARFGREGGMKYRLYGPSLAFSPDGKTVAAVLGNDAIELWDVASAKLVKTISGHEVEKSSRVAVRLVLGAGTRMTRADLAFSADGQAIAASLGNATVRQFAVGTGTEVAPAAGHLSGLIAAGSDGRTVVTVSKESVRVWDAAAGKEVRQWPLSPPAVAAAVSADGTRLATSSGGGKVRLWDPATGKSVRDIDTRRADVAGLGFSPDGKLLATKAELNSAVNLWDLGTGAHVRTIGQDGEPVLSGGRVTIEFGGVQNPNVVFSADGRHLAAAGDKKQLAVWDVGTGAPVCEIAGQGRGLVAAFAFSPNGQVVAALSAQGTVTGYEVATGEKRYELKPTDHATESPAATPGAGVMSAAGFGRGTAAGGGVAFTADGRFVLAGAGGPAVRAWDALTGQEVGQWKGHQGSVSVLRATPDGRSLVSGSVDTTALVWDLGQLQPVELTRETPLAAADAEALWADLAKPDPAAAFAATRKLLTDRAQAVDLLRSWLKPVPKAADAQVEKLVADLGGAFSARRKAAEDLERLGELAAPHLRKALEGNPPLDLRQRIERLLEKATVQKPQGDPLRELRAVELLELAGTAEAKKTLDGLAQGAPAARLTREAAAAASRMTK